MERNDINEENTNKLQNVGESETVEDLDTTDRLAPKITCGQTTTGTSCAPCTSGKIKRFSTATTQTPLTLTRVTIAKPSEERSIDATITPMYIDNIEKTEFSLRLNNVAIKQKVTLDAKTNSNASDLSEVSTQATPPHPSLQISTSLCSNKSGPKSEILTVTTDYGNQTPDARSILVDTVDRNGTFDHCAAQERPILTNPFNRVHPSMHLSMREPFGLSRELMVPPPSSGSIRNNLSSNETRHRLCGLRDCLPCISASSIREPEAEISTRGAPPTYSSIYANRATLSGNRRSYLPTNHSSFVAPIPPPSYAQAQGIRLTPYSVDHMLSVSPSVGGIWSSRPTAAICPRCAIIVVTVIEVRRSTVTHVSAFILCLCGCWPCCMIPYCMNSCKTTDHYCPICHTHLGTYAPW